MPTPFHVVSAVAVPIPPELTDEASLLAHLAVTPAELKKIWWRREGMYYQFDIARKSKTRVIDAPDARLKHLQRKLAALLDQLYRVRNPVHGFVPGKSVKTNAASHLGRRYVLNIDIQSFFPTITEKRIIGVVRALGVDRRVAEIIARIACFQGRLPQGAPTSPVLSNMICFRMDRQLMAFAKATRCVYTRYADDITLSCHQPATGLFDAAVPAAGRVQPELLAADLRAIIAANGFTIHPEKAHYADRHSRRSITGIKINEFLNVDRSFVRDIRAALFSVKSLGQAAAQTKFDGMTGGGVDLCAHLLGRLSWLRHVRGQSDPVFRAMAVRFNELFPTHSIDVLPTVAEIRDRSAWVVEHFEGDMAQGTAFFLKDVGLVTAAHCVVGADEVELYHPSKRANVFMGKVLARDNARDLALLEHAIPATEYFELERAPAGIAVGDVVTAVGYPGFGPGDRLNVRDGKVSSLPVKHGIQKIEVTQKLAQGMSGGPILRADDTVVGVVHSGGPGEGRDFAIHVSVLNDWLNELAA